MSVHPASPSAIVVGAGIVGAACAYYLSKAGLQVTIVEAAVPAAGTTAAGMGHIVAMDDSEAQLQLCKHSLSLWRDFFAENGSVAEYEKCGTLWIAADEDEYEQALVRQQYYAANGIRAEMLNSGELRNMEPMLRSDLVGALLVPDDGVLYPPLAAARLLSRAEALGAKLHTHWPVLEVGQGSVRGEQGLLRADAIVIAAGGSTGAILGEPWLRPRRGHLVITDRYPGAIRHQIVELGYLRSAHELAASASVAFNVQPRATGQLLIGSSRELGTEDRGASAEVVTAMLNRAMHFMPALGKLSATRVWTGNRPASADKLPLIGQLPSRANVWVAAGHEGLGITTSLATGSIITDMITGRAPAIDVRPFAPDRPTAKWN